MAADQHRGDAVMATLPAIDELPIVAVFATGARLRWTTVMSAA
jgi:hypothetical protein